VCERYGPPEVVRVLDVPRPEPRSDQVLVRVRAAAVTSGDARIRAARFPGGFAVPARLAFGVRRPRRRILGNSFSGEVEAAGDDVRDVAVGDVVCGMTGMAMGTHAELLVVPARRAVRVPAGVGLGPAAGVLFGGTTAWHLLQKAGVGPGATVLVNGGSGAVGTNAVQLARHLGATVTGVTSGANADLVRRLGAEEVVDHTERDVASLDERFDVVLDTVGNLDIREGRRLLRPGGRLVLAVATLGQILRARGDVIAGSVPERAEDVEALLGLVASGELEVVVEHELGLDDIVAAHARVDSGRKVGNVLVRP
jgi:NADPH:quinone reductase-like Zn-dependent oxidoreductase